jgi:hypothetical protein
MLERSPLDRGGRGSDRYRVKTILAPLRRICAGVVLSNVKRRADGKPESDAPDGPEIRQIHGEDPRRALLLLYPLSQAAADWNRRPTIPMILQAGP